MSFDAVVDDGKAVANKGVQVLVGLGGIVAGIGLAMTDIGADLADKLMELVDIKSDLVANAIILLIGIIILVTIVSIKGMVSSAMLKQLFTFFAIMMATYLIVKVISIVVGFFKGDLKITEDGA